MHRIIHLEDILFQRKEGFRLSLPSLAVNRGEHLFIQGPSGSGKTTLLNLIVGVSTPNRGKIVILDNDLTGFSYHQRDQFRADHFGILFQQFNLLTYLSMLENVLAAGWFSKRKSIQISNLTDEAFRLLSILLPEFGKNDFYQKPVEKLSVGQQQRVAAARALMGKPEIIVADEPTSALDQDNQERFLELLFREVEEQQSTLIFVSHDPQLKKSFSQTFSLTQNDE